MAFSRRQLATYEFGSFRLDLAARGLFFGVEPVPLTSKTFEILRALIENSGRLVTKEELMNKVWGSQAVEENNLTVRIAALRKTLSRYSQNRYIETVFGHGYRFAAKVEEIPGRRAVSKKDEVFSLIAVLPLRNENNQPTLDYICYGVTESIINSLSQITDLKVMSHSTVSRYKAVDLDPRVIGEELEVQAILVGNVRQRDGHIIFNIEVVDVSDGSRMWGTTYQRQFSDLHDLQDEIAREVCDSLRIKLSSVDVRRIRKGHTSNPEAYHLYLKGRYFWNKRSAAVLRSINYFKRATRVDPQYALAYSGLADAYIMLSGFGFGPPRKIMPKAKRAVMRALDIDNQLTEAHVSLGLVLSNFDWNWSEAEQAYCRAIELSPDKAPAHHYYSILLAKQGRLDKAVAEIRKAFEIDPISLHVHMARARISYFAKQYDVAAKHCKEMLELDPTFGPANGLISMVYLEQKHYERAISQCKRMIPFSGRDYPGRNKKGINGTPGVWEADPEAIGVLGFAYAQAGNRKKANEMLKRLEQLEISRYVEPLSVALVHIGLKDYDKAFEWLDRAFADRSNILTYMKVWPFFSGLKNDPRYQVMVKRVGLE
jgi:adenylate cyclase